jgi:tape measure domain-containing protein
VATSIGWATLQVIPSLRGLDSTVTRQLNSQAGRVGSQAGERAGRGFHDHYAGWIQRIVAVTAAAGIGLGLEKIVSTGIKASASLEQTQVAFTSLLGSTKAANKQISQLQAFAAKTPFSQQDVFGYAQQYFALAQSVGLAKDQVKPFLTAVGDIAAVTGASTQNIHNAVLAIGQIGSAGKVTQDNLRQISEAFPGFNAAAAIAAATGKTTAQVMQDIQSGTLDANTGIHALIVGMQKFPGAAGAMAKQAQTLNGLWSTFTDTIKIRLTQAFTPLIPVVKQQLAQLTPVISQALKTFAPAITSFAQNLQPVIAPLVRGLSTVFSSALSALGPVFATLAPVIQPLANTFAQLAKAIGPVLVLLAQTIAQVGPPLLAIFGDLLTTLQPLVTALTQALTPVLPVLAQAFQQIGAALRPIVGQLVAIFAQQMKDLAPVLPGLVQALGNLAVALLNLIQPFIPVIGLMTELSTLVNKPLIRALTVLVNALAAVVNATARLANKMKDLFGWLAGPIGTAIRALRGPLHTLENMLRPLAELADRIAQLKGIVNTAKGVFHSAGTAISYFSGQTGTIGQAATGAASGVAGLTGQMLNLNSAIANAQIQTATLADLLGQLQRGEISTAQYNRLSRAAKHPGGPDFSIPKFTVPNLGSTGAGSIATPFDASSLTSFLQTAIGANVNPLISALNAIIASAKQSGHALSQSFINQLRGENSQLIALTRQREKIAETLRNVQQEIVNVRSTVRGTFDITTAGQNSFGEPVTFFDVRSAVTTAVRNARQFVHALKRLLREGLNPQLVAQLAEAGPTALPQAQALLAATPRQLRGLNRQYRALTNLGTEIGKVSATALYGAGEKSVDGFVRGLKSKKNELTKAIRELAEAMVAQLKASLGIHSPSKVMHQLGQFSGEGFALGLASKYGDVQRASGRLANGALPTSQMRTWTGANPATSGGDTHHWHIEQNWPPYERPSRAVPAAVRAATYRLGR